MNNANKKYRVFTGCLKFIKAIYLRINLKLSQMYNAKRLKALQNVQADVFEAFKQFISYYNTEVDPGQYLTFIKVQNDSIDFKVGAEIFSAKSQINLNEKQIKFETYAWIFDLSKEGRYRHDRILDLDFYYDVDDKLKFYQMKDSINKEGDHRQFHVIYHSNMHEYFKQLEPFFEQFEKYTDDRLSGRSNGLKSNYV